MQPEVEVQFDATDNRLVTRAGEVALPWRVARFFEMLQSAGDELVARDAAQTVLWPDVVVTRNSFDQMLTQARRCLEQAGLDSSMLETVPRQGYRLKFRFAANLRAKRPQRRAAVFAGLGVVAALLVAGAWHQQRDAAFTCQIHAKPLSLDSMPGAGILHVFNSEADYEEFRRGQEAAGVRVKRNDELKLSDQSAVIACRKD